MKLVDLSHLLTETIPVFPGDPRPRFETRSTIADTGYYERRLAISSHAGTHMDAPAHMVPGGPTLDRLPLEHFHGPAVALDCRPAGHRIEATFLAEHQSLLSDVDFVLLFTGWSDRWPGPAYLEDFPALTPEAATWLAARGLKGVGVDTISVDVIDSTECPVHRLLLERETVIIENLAGLTPVLGTRFMFSCFPLRLEDADGSPVRAVAHLS